MSVTGKNMYDLTCFGFCNRDLNTLDSGKQYCTKPGYCMSVQYLPECVLATGSWQRVSNTLVICCMKYR